MKDKLLKLIQAKEARKAELAKNSNDEKITVAELRSINAELETLNADIAEMRGMVSAIDAEKSNEQHEEDDEELEKRSVNPTGKINVLGTYGVSHTEQRDQDTKEPKEKAEKRGMDLKEGRSVTIASIGVILPNYQASDIKATFNQVSSLVDRVNIKTLTGGESFKQAYSTGYGEGGYTTEGGNPTDAEATFGYADIAKTKITAYAEDSEELVKLPGADYDGEVQKGIRIALRKKLTKEILIGDGATGHFVGIFDDGAGAISDTTDKSIIEIDETTLDEIMMSFGGDEDVEDVAVLVLNKLDLKAFKMLRDADGKKIYEVKTNGNTGTIDGVPYVINSACKAVSSPSTTTGQYAMAYGPLSNYTMAIFSDTDIQRSTDYKFKEGMICHRGVIFAGGNVTAKNGFLRIKKG
jgi:HK97 family phage major capsid protein